MELNKKDKNDPSNTSIAYDLMKPRWDLMEAVLGGTETMRAAAYQFLPKHDEETVAGYTRRINSAVLNNITEQTLQTLSSKPFADGVAYDDNIPEAVVEQVLHNVDLLGNNLEVFAKNWFREGIAKAMCHVLVDYPRTKPKEDGTPRTLEDDRAQKIRPYWVLIKPECVLAARASVIDGREVLEHVRIMETLIEEDGFTEVVIQQIRVLEIGSVTLYRKEKGTKKWKAYDEWETNLEFIPLVTYYADRDDLMFAKPPLLDLAYLNIAHWQTTADQRHALTVSSFPILACSGASPEDSDPIVIGPNKVLYNPDAQGRFYYVEHTGTAIQSGRDELNDLEDKMAGYGAEFLRKKSGGQTATARALDSAESLSDLAGMTMVFEDAIAQAIWYTSRWMGVNTEGASGRVILTKDFSSDRVEINTDVLDKARARRDISRTAYLTALQREGVLPDDFDAETDAELIAAEANAMWDLGGSLTDLDPLAKDEDNDEQQ